MIVALGLDVCDSRRVARSMERFGERLCTRILTATERGELQLLKNKAAFVARRIAAKEAAVKALGTGIAQGVGWQQVAVHSQGGRPVLCFSGMAQRVSEQMGVTTIHISITDERYLAIAVVVLERRG